MRWRILSVSALAGAAALWVLFPRYDLTARSFHLALDRDAAIQRLREEASRRGIDISGWKTFAALSLVDTVLDLKAGFPDAPVLRSFTGARIRTAAVSPEGARVDASFFADGRPESFQSAMTRTASSPSEELAYYTRAEAPRFAEVTRGASGRGGLQYSWEWTDLSRDGIVARFELLQDSGKSVRARYSLSASDVVLESARLRNHRHRLDALTSAGSALPFVGLTIGFWTFFRSMSRRSDHLRFPIVFTLIILSMIALPFAAGIRTDTLTLTTPEAGAGSGSMLVIALLATAVGGILNYFLLGAGYAVLPESERPRWAGMQHVSKSRFGTQRVGQELLCGLLAAIPLLAILLAGAALFGRTARIQGIGFLLSRHPVLSLLEAVNPIDIIGLFGMLLPVGLRFVKPKWMALALVAGTGGLFCAALRRPLESNIGMDIALSGAFVAGLFLVYRYFGLLAVVVAAAATAAAHHILAFLFQTNDSLFRAGLEAGGTYAAAVLASGLLARLGRRFSEAAVEAEMSPQGSDVSRSERDRLHADFSVARRAQQNLLPSSAPQVPGLDIAAVCRPAREVGGDLFEFPRLKDGRLAFCVADVSGKGVPAALYMTLTTGILAASAARSRDLREVTVEINRHLHAACKHRTFVTMALGVWNADAGTFQHIRAGHNPLLHRSKSGATRFVQPRGLGLGLVSTVLFENALECHTLPVAPGDTLVLYSDGLVEAMNPRKEQFGEDRLVRVVEECAGFSAADTGARILDAVDRFTRGAEPHDDLTLMVVSFLTPDGASPTTPVF